MQQRLKVGREWKETRAFQLHQGCFKHNVIQNA